MYFIMVEKAKHYIHEGDIFQVVLSNPMRAKAEGSLFDTYRVLRATNPSPYMFYFSSDDIELAGASPETLVKLEGKKLTTFPLAAVRDELPDTFRVTAEAEDGEIMAVEHTEYPIYGVQFHPESVMTPDGKVMVQNFINIVMK